MLGGQWVAGERVAGTTVTSRPIWYCSPISLWKKTPVPRFARPAAAMPVNLSMPSLMRQPS